MAFVGHPHDPHSPGRHAVEQPISRSWDGGESPAAIVAGPDCDSVEMAQHWSARGATMLTCATDTALLEGGLRDALAQTAVASSAEGGSSTASADVAAAPSES